LTFDSTGKSRGGGIIMYIKSCIKLSHKYDDIITVEKLLIAWQGFLHGKKKRNDVIIFEAKLMDNIFSLRSDLKNKR